MKKGKDDTYFKEPANVLTREAIKRAPVKNIPSEDDPTADEAVLEEALLRHCKSSERNFTAA
jgi:hypothetical protein